MRSLAAPVPPSGRTIVTSGISRRRNWLMDNLTPRKAANMLLAAGQFAMRSEVMRAFPVIAKVDISPLCNLRCTMCVHARPSAGAAALLGEQRFSSGQRMSVDRYREVASQLAGRTSAVSLFYLGDPLVHPHLEEICDATREAGMNSHVSTNFSFVLSEERLRSLIKSGLTHLKVCVDGVTQETYGRTRVGGRIAVVLDNLRRVLRIRREMNRRYPRVEVQYIKYRHNLGEIDEARARCLAWGADQFTEMWGSLHNVTDLLGTNPPLGRPRPPRTLPRCLWPYFALLVRYDGGVIPCSNHRQGSQYTEGEDRHELGNVFESGVWAVWNSPAYRRLRRLSANPRRARTEPDLACTFCEHCPELFETDVDRYFRRANGYNWEEMYEQDARGHVIRKPLVQISRGIGTPAEQEPVNA
jgi:MoaA/NifB/PqqE/SkfB family radical SAM enzyme